MFLLDQGKNLLEIWFSAPSKYAPKHFIKMQNRETHLFRQFRNWTLQNAFPEHGLNVYDFADTGRGLRATIQITGNIVQVPKNSLIIPQTAYRIFPSLNRSACNSVLRQQLLIALVLCHYKIQGIASEWAPYINILPSSFNVASLIPSQLLALMPIDIQIIAENQLKNYNQAYQNVCIELNDHPWIPSASFFRWAWFNVHTRSISLSKVKELDGSFRNLNNIATRIILAPFLDCFNHTADISINVFFDLCNEMFTISTNHIYEPGQQVFINYGPHDNNFLFAEYGFMIENNLYNSVCMDGRVSEFFGKQSQGLIQILISHGMFNDYFVSNSDRGFRMASAVRLWLCGESSAGVNEWKKLQISNGCFSDSKKELKVSIIIANLLKEQLRVNQENLRQINELFLISIDPYVIHCCRQVLIEAIEILQSLL